VNFFCDDYEQIFERKFGRISFFHQPGNLLEKNDEFSTPSQKNQRSSKLQFLKESTENKDCEITSFSNTKNFFSNTTGRTQSSRQESSCFYRSYCVLKKIPVFEFLPLDIFPNNKDRSKNRVSIT